MATVNKVDSGTTPDMDADCLVTADSDGKVPNCNNSTVPTLVAPPNVELGVITAMNLVILVYPEMPTMGSGGA